MSTEFRGNEGIVIIGQIVLAISFFILYNAG